MASNLDEYGDTVTVNFEAVAVVKRKRAKKHRMQYTNVQCNGCNNWWIMVCLGNKKKLHCPWCGNKCKVISNEDVK